MITMVYLLRQEVSKVLSDNFGVLIGLGKFDFQTLVDLVDDFAVNDELGGTGLVPVFEGLKVMRLAFVT